MEWTEYCGAFHMDHVAQWFSYIVEVQCIRMFRIITVQWQIKSKNNQQHGENSVHTLESVLIIDFRKSLPSFALASLFRDKSDEMICVRCRRYQLNEADKRIWHFEPTNFDNCSFGDHWNNIFPVKAFATL